MDPVLRAAAIATSIIVAAFVAVVVGLLVSRSTPRLAPVRRLISQVVSAGAFLLLLAAIIAIGQH